MLKIIIPLAGSSEMFKQSGFSYPKPLIEIKGKTMIQWVIENAFSQLPSEFIFIIKEEDAFKYHLDNTLRLLAAHCQIVKIKRDTKGALCSVLMALDKIQENDNIVIVNGDQIIDENFNKILDFWSYEKADAGVLTFNSVHPRWSYARIENGQVVQTAEKNPISQYAIAGYYYFAKADEFKKAAFQTILNDVQTDGSYFISPVMNEYVLQNKKVSHYHIKNDQYHSFYSPQLIKEFENKRHL